MTEQVEAEHRRECVGGDVEVFDVDGMDDDEVAVRTVSGRRSGTDVAGEAGVVAQLDSAIRKVPTSVAPAPPGSSVTVAGMLNTAQCQNPLAVGASGSYTVTAKLLVSAGNPDQRQLR